MKAKNLKLIIYFTSCVLVLALLLVFGFGATAPETTTKSFDFSITYEYGGKTETVTDTVTYLYEGEQKAPFEHTRYWSDEYTKGDRGIYPIFEDEQGDALYLCAGLDAHYYMGDPTYVEEKELFEQNLPEATYGEPYVQYCHSEGESYDPDEIADKTGFKVISFDYPEPIENSFSFAGIDLNSMAVWYVGLYSLVAVGVSLILFRKKKELKYKPLDIVSLVLNVIVAVVVLPNILTLCLLWELTGATAFEAALAHLLPAITIAFVGVSIHLRRNGRSVLGLIAQFVGPIILVILFVLSLTRPLAF